MTNTSSGEGGIHPSVQIHESAYVDEPCDIGAGTRIWHFSHIMRGCRLGRDCVIGQNVMIGPNVVVGNRCKIQNNVSLYDGVLLEDGVFCGPSCVFTNVNNPRADIERKDEFRPTTVRRGATIGANATIVCGHEIGAYAFIGAGAVVTRDVPAPRAHGRHPGTTHRMDEPRGRQAGRGPGLSDRRYPLSSERPGIAGGACVRSIPFIDLKAQQARLRHKIDDAIARVLDHGQYILGPEVGQFEQELADFTGAGHVVSCANGTDALTLVHLAEGVGPGDAVLAPSMTFVATLEPTLLCGAMPVYVDIDPATFNMSPDGLEDAYARARSAGLRPRLIIPVDLYGVPAEYDAIMDFAKAHDMVVIADAAQSMGARRGDQRTGTMGHYSCTSFFPAKPLGCYGDGGAVFTDDDEAAATLRSIRRYHGKGADKYDNVRVGLNSRLDTLQAAILREKLRILDDETEARERVAQRYNALLDGAVETPAIPNSTRSAWAQYTIMVDWRERAAGSPEGTGNTHGRLLSQSAAPAVRVWPWIDARKGATGDRPGGRSGSEPAHAFLY